jgi:hypothetical protein
MKKYSFGIIIGLPVITLSLIFRFGNSKIPSVQPGSADLLSGNQQEITPTFLITEIYPGNCQDWSLINDPAFGLGDPSGNDYSGEDTFEVAIFKGQLYLGMEADNLYGAWIWRTKEGVDIPNHQNDWEQVVDDAFGDAVNNDHIDSLESFNGFIYASTATQDATHEGTQIWRTTGEFIPEEI